MVSLAQMLDNSKFPMSGFFTVSEADGRTEPTAVLGSTPAAVLCLGSLCSWGSSLPALKQREVLHKQPVLSTEGTPPALSGSHY